MLEQPKIYLFVSSPLIIIEYKATTLTIVADNKVMKANEINICFQEVSNSNTMKYILKICDLVRPAKASINK